MKLLSKLSESWIYFSSNSSVFEIKIQKDSKNKEQSHWVNANQKLYYWLHFKKLFFLKKHNVFSVAKNEWFSHSIFIWILVSKINQTLNVRQKFSQEIEEENPFLAFGTEFTDFFPFPLETNYYSLGNVYSIDCMNKFNSHNFSSSSSMMVLGLNKIILNPNRISFIFSWIFHHN